ncbi:Uncharacterised protein [uncultured archaeon]|nr:Uncharacterised protein [uncultured archaeon]
MIQIFEGIGKRIYSIKAYITIGDTDMQLVHNSLTESRLEEEYHEKKYREKIESIHAKMPWDFENDIGHLQIAMSYLKDSAIKSEWEDDGSGIEYTEEQYLKADRFRELAIDEIEQAMNHILDMVKLH